MAILSQLNPIRFYKDKRARQFERTPDNIESMVYYPSGMLPSFQVGVDKIYSDGVDYDWNLEFYTHEDIKVTSIESFSLISGSSNGRRTVAYEGAITEGFGSGYYYYKLFNNVEEYYSDVFASASIDEENMIGFYIQHSDIRIGGIPTLNNMGSFSQTFYLYAESLGIKPKTDQNAQQDNGIDVILFGTRVITHEFEIDANESIYIYLTSLGLLQVNGIVTISYLYQQWNATDFVVEEGTNHNDGLYQLKFSFVDESETVSVING